MRQRGDNLVAIFNLDSLGGKSQADIDAGVKTNATLYTVDEGKVLADLMTEVNESYAIGLRQSVVKRTSPGDDDGSFVNAGYGKADGQCGVLPLRRSRVPSGRRRCGARGLRERETDDAGDTRRRATRRSVGVSRRALARLCSGTRSVTCGGFCQGRASSIFLLCGDSRLRDRVLAIGSQLQRRW